MNTLIYDNTLKLYRPKDHKTFKYSDGDANESNVFETLKNSSDNSIFSGELIDAIKDWPSEYHLSPDRANILRPIQIGSQDDVLEVGGGCGAITRFLGETGANIYTVEGSLRRAMCISQRCKDLSNVNVYCSNVYELKIEKKFDIITLIGVFEYSAQYSPFEHPFNDALNFYKKLLKPNGKIVIAIENQLGLKYFIGHEEDHKGLPFWGIENRYVLKGVRTFGEEELVSIVKDSGFRDYTIIYPFPDYKLPKLFLTKDGIEEDQFNCSDLLFTSTSRSYSGRFSAQSNEKLIWPTLEKNRLIGQLSNSFLLTIYNERPEELQEKNLAFFYTTNRGKAYNTETLFYESGKDIVVKKKNLLRSPPSVDPIIVQSLESSNYVIGKNLGYQIYQSIEKRDEEAVKILLKLWLNHLIQYGVEGDELSLSSQVKAEYIDCNPNNLILQKNGELVYIDQEWRYLKKLSLSYVLIRYLEELRTFPSFKYNFRSYKRFVDGIFIESQLGKSSRSDFLRFKSAETAIRETIYHGSSSNPWRGSKIRTLLKKIFYRLLNILDF